MSLNDNSNVVIKATNLSKSYKIFNSHWKRFLYHVFKIENGKDFWALRDINFEINKGETFGIIGRNGSGKSTLLQIIAGILKQTNGELSINGKVSALLELGSGFNPESTGYENIFINAAILGVDKEGIESKIDEIIDFADIGDFINQPVKMYSSGMFVRLAFAVAINVDADIILIDEALAVGDVFFRQKCYSKLNELKEKGKTIILVSHGINEVEQFCDRALLINEGIQIMLDRSDEVVQKYYMVNQIAAQGNYSSQDDFYENCKINHMDNNNMIIMFNDSWSIKKELFFDLNLSKEHNNSKATYKKIGIFDENGNPKYVFKQGEYAYFYTEVELYDSIEKPVNGLVIINHKNIIIHGKNTFQTNLNTLDKIVKGQIVSNCIKIKLDIEEGEYTFECGFSTLPKKVYASRKEMSHEELDKYIEILASRRNAGAFSVQGKLVESSSELEFYGVVNLKSEFDTIVF